MKAFIPRIEISLSQIQHNTQMLCELYGKQGISVMGVSKAVSGEPLIIEAMIQGGVKFIADSRLENIKKMKCGGISTQFVLLRTALSQAESIVLNVDISLNTEIETIKELNRYAFLHNKVHQIILIVEMGDLREGIMPQDIFSFVKQVQTLSHIQIVGLGCNLACYGGIKPDSHKMDQLSKLTNAVEKKFQIELVLVSGGNSANYEWYKSTSEIGRINNLRIGESILLGCETLERQVIPTLCTNAFKLIAEVIESKLKPSIPFGEARQDAFGKTTRFRDLGIHNRAIVALGKQDTLISGLSCDDNLEILGSSSDHVVLDSKNFGLKVGTEVNFHLDYGSLLAAMNSQSISKQFV